MNDELVWMWKEAEGLSEGTKHLPRGIDIPIIFGLKTFHFLKDVHNRLGGIRGMKWNRK
jgi:hypothetical protein